MNDTVRRQAEKAEFFPFVSGELLEEHRKHLNAQMCSEIQQYMTAKTRKQKASADPPASRYNGSSSALSQQREHGGSRQNAWLRNSGDFMN